MTTRRELEVRQGPFAPIFRIVRQPEAIQGNRLLSGIDQFHPIFAATERILQSAVRIDLVDQDLSENASSKRSQDEQQR